MRVLVLVISDDSHPVYAVHRELWRQVTHPAFRVVFVSARPDLSESILEGDVLWTPGEESFSGIIRKTMAAFDFFAGGSQDYIIRTNLSSQFRWNRLLKVLQTAPRTRFWCGVVGNHEGIQFASGAGIFMSPDVVQFLRDHRQKAFESPQLDDVAMGSAIGNAFPLQGAGRVNMFDRWQDPLDCFHIRLKSDHSETRMTHEIEFRKRLIAMDTNPGSQ